MAGTDWRTSAVPVNRSFHLVDKIEAPKIKTLKPQVLFVTEIIIIASFFFLIAWLFHSYVGDDWSSSPADERSVPAARTY